MRLHSPGFHGKQPAKVSRDAQANESQLHNTGAGLEARPQDIVAKSLSLIAEQLLAEFKIYEDSAYSYAGNYLRLWSGRSLL